MASGQWYVTKTADNIAEKIKLVVLHTMTFENFSIYYSFQSTLMPKRLIFFPFVIFFYYILKPLSGFVSSAYGNFIC